MNLIYQALYLKDSYILNRHQSVGTEVSATDSTTNITKSEDFLFSLKHSAFLNAPAQLSLMLPVDLEVFLSLFAVSPRHECPNITDMSKKKTKSTKGKKLSTITGSITRC